MAAGVLLAGLPNVFQQLFQLYPTDAIKPLFLLYSILGLTVMGIYFFLSKKIELDESMDKESIPKQYTCSSHSLSTNSKITIAKLSGLFAVDSFAGGFLIQSIVSFWFYTKFQADLILLSYIFYIAGILTAFSFVIASKVADRVDLINRMVLVILPSNILIIIVAFAPTLPIAIGLYIARMALSQMDVPTRQSYVMSVVREEKRREQPRRE
jgi:predicted MFS family arabinose efflux permease